MKAMKIIKVKYQVNEPVLDFHKAKDGDILVHPEADWFPPCQVGGDSKGNLVARDESEYGDVDGVMADCDIVLDRTYHMKAYNQAMMETFRTFTQLDRYGRLHVISSTQIVFHVRRILSRALGIPRQSPRKQGRKDQSIASLYTFQLRCLRRAWSYNCRSFRT